ncbi:MAG: hypothetical protein NDI69_15885 [Bacteriovoracaceae bacterium]|nr:hypothetical protein [Bacteriovoracaceae bacterium]
MKNLTLILMTVLSLNCWSGGGVDVGNHSPKSFKGSFVIPDFKSEESMVAHVQSLLPKIETGSLKEVNNLILAARCSSSDIKFDSLEVVTSYSVNEKILRLEKEFTALVTVELQGCKRPGFLPYYDHFEF